MGASHFETTSPEKWNGVSANNCATSHIVFVQVFLHDSNGNVIDFCETGNVTNWAKCQAQGNAASALHNHRYEYGLFNKTFFGWQSND
jgi:hypothetical protein